MATVTAFEAKTRFGEILDRAANGEEIVITRYDRPVARLIPDVPPDREKARRAFEALDRSKDGLRRRGFKPLTTAEILSARDEGRK